MEKETIYLCTPKHNKRVVKRDKFINKTGMAQWKRAIFKPSQNAISEGLNLQP